MNGSLLVAALMLPVAAMLWAFLVYGPAARFGVLLLLAAGVPVSLAVASVVLQTGQPLVCEPGNWGVPLGLVLRADGLSALMMVVSSVIVLAAGLCAPPELTARPPARLPSTFWVLLPGVAAALCAVVLGYDLFNLYVALELLTFAAVPLVSLGGSADNLRAALRYLLFALAGSVLYLLGVGLVYGLHGVLDIGLLAARVQPGWALWLVLALMTAGLAAKTALFPLHLWLPPAHAGAMPVASALLSALVIKGSFFIALRLWFDLAPCALDRPVAVQGLGVLGAGAILVGGVMAWRQEKLKMLIAYSTVAQIGYLFLAFPLAAGGGLSAGMMQAMAHALAKASMFLAAGLLVEGLGGERLSGLRGAGRTMPWTVLALVLSATSLVGIPPTGGFLAKWLLLRAAAQTGQWWWSVVILTGGLLAGAYMLRVLAPLLDGRGETPVRRRSVAGGREAIVVLLAVGAWLPGLWPLLPLSIVRAGSGIWAEVVPW